MTKSEIINRLASCKKKFEKEYKISRMALFGSYARGDQNEESDVDVWVEIDPTIGLEFVSLAEKIEKEMGIPTDLVSSRAIKPRYQKIIQTELIYV